MTAILNEIFSGAECCRRLGSPRLKFTKGTNINIFPTNLKICVKEVYILAQVHDETIEGIAINLELAHLDDDIKCDIKKLRLIGHRSLERIEFFITNLRPNFTLTLRSEIDESWNSTRVGKNIEI